MTISQVLKSQDDIPSEIKKIDFNTSGFLTLGVEVELQIIDPQNMDLSPRANEALSLFAGDDKLTQEIFQSMLEIRTDICESVVDVERDLSASFDKLHQVARNLGFSLATTGCHPTACYSERIVSEGDRYKDLIDRNQWIAQRLAICGLHIHLGMKDGDDCIRYMNFLTRFLPHVLALSASSAFWRGRDTGLATCRPTIFESMPSAGHPYVLNNWAHFEHLVHSLRKARAIRAIKDLWWDIRPSPKFGTLEVRVCDGTATLSETLAITAFLQLLCRWFADHDGTEYHQPEWIYRENKWRAMRHGLKADLVLDESGTNKPIKDDILMWLEVLQPYAEDMGYKHYTDTIAAIMDHGNSTDRQRAVFEKAGSLDDVIRHNIREFERRKPIFQD